MIPRTTKMLPLFLALGLVATGHARDKRKSAVTDPAKLGPDFAVQGEYLGTVERKGKQGTLGAQVVARGDGKFHIIGYWGGLPGEGWQGDKKIEADGKTQNGVTIFPAFPAKGHTGKLERGVLTISNSENQKQDQLKRLIRKSPTLGKKPPAGAVVLFDGSTADHFKNGRMTGDGLLMPGVASKRNFQSIRLHVEFRTPFMPHARGQGRGNSGCFLQGRFEVQILDTFGLAGKHNECAGIYSIRDCDLNMCFPPLSWQTFDIDFTAAEFDANGKKTKNALITVRHNGVVVHKDAEIPKPAPARIIDEGPEPGPVFLQDHKNPVQFRNIWLVEK